MFVAADNVRYRAGRKPILNSVSVTLHEGINCVLGPNGAGKTTLLRILATALAPEAGQVNVVVDEERRPLRREQIGYVPQSFSFYPHFSVRQLVEYVARMKRVPGKQVTGAVERALNAAQLEGVANQRLATLSGGTLRRAAIAQSIVNDPVLLVLDEPTVGLDPEQRRRFLDLVKSISPNRIIVFSTHLIEDVRYAADRVVIMNAGRILSTGSPQEFATEPTTEALAAAYDRMIDEGFAHGD
jgi:ABC-2 type transport system ATP-binding protein